MTLTPPLLFALVAGTTVLIVEAAIEQREHDWRRCLNCRGWFDRHGALVTKPRWIARFAIHRNGVCSKCSEEWRAAAHEAVSH